MMLLTTLLVRGNATVERTVLSMGTTLTARVEHPVAKNATSALEAAIRAVEETERLLSTWQTTTPLSRANHSRPGTSVPLSGELHGLLTEVFGWSSDTERAFDPSIGALVDAWDLRGKGRHPTASELSHARQMSGPDVLRLSPGSLTRMRPGAWIDAGGFGKGAALREASRALHDAGVTRALLDLGGQVLAVARPGEAPWEIAVSHPVRREEATAWLRVAGVSVATSGNSERGLMVEGQRIGHLLDPRTGRPAPDWGSVTVVAQDPLVADVLSTALYVMGPEHGMAWLADHPDVGALFLVRSDDRIVTLHNRAMDRWLVTLPAGAGPVSTTSPERRTP
jgi:thiamine biosynthesis lipoprotein